MSLWPDIATGVSVLTLILATVLGPFQKLLSMTSLDIQQWLICTAVALSIIVVSEIRKAAGAPAEGRRGHSSRARITLERVTGRDGWDSI
jgi:cation transport ATPase-like protein